MQWARAASAEAIMATSLAIDRCNQPWRTRSRRPVLSLLIPFRDDNVRPLVRSLLAAAMPLEADLELLVGDDASRDVDLARRAIEDIAAAPIPARLIRPTRNLGRAAIRNILTACSSASHVLFVDAEMTMPGSDYLTTYLDLIRGDPAVVFGGYAVTDSVLGGDDLSLYECTRIQCLPARRRLCRPWRFLYGGNLLIRREIALTCPFDEGFRGWGWEDIEFGMRVSDRFPIIHVDNPVQRSRLLTTEQVCARIEESFDNFHRLALLQAQKTGTLRLYRLSRLAGCLPLRGRMRWVLRRAALGKTIPLPLRWRMVALKLYQALVYAG
jgi:Glycosyl transferase family 2